MLTVNGDRDVVERQLGGGELACPACGGVLGRWGNAAERQVLVLDGPKVRLVPRRARCLGCGRTHVLLPVWCLARRADAGEVIGLAGKAHPGPFGDPLVVSRATIDRWIRAWNAGGFAALAPPARQVTLRTDAQVLELAAGLKRGKPTRTAAQVQRILQATCTWSPSARTLQRHFERLELTTRPDGLPPQAFGRFQAERPNELWTGDALHGPKIAGRKAYLFCFIEFSEHGGVSDGAELGDYVVDMCVTLGLGWLGGWREGPRRRGLPRRR